MNQYEFDIFSMYLYYQLCGIKLNSIEQLWFEQRLKEAGIL